MGYFVATSGRVHLPEASEQHALTVLEVELGRCEGWFDVDQHAAEVEKLDSLARFVGATVERDGDWLVLSTDKEGDPKWSEQATAFYTGLGRFAHDGEVRLRGEDGAAWSYVYSPDGVRQVGQNGWDGSGPAVSLEKRASAAESAPSQARAGRPVAMAALLIIGVLLLVAVASLAAGFVD